MAWPWGSCDCQRSKEAEARGDIAGLDLPYAWPRVEVGEVPGLLVRSEPIPTGRTGEAAGGDGLATGRWSNADEAGRDWSDGPAGCRCCCGVVARDPSFQRHASPVPWACERSAAAKAAAGGAGKVGAKEAGGASSSSCSSPCILVVPSFAVAVVPQPGRTTRRPARHPQQRQQLS